MSAIQSEDIVVGDANFDGLFNSTDLLDLFQLGSYDGPADLSIDWSAGDFNGDLQFSTKDLVMAFIAGQYDRSPPSGVQNVPEPNSVILLFLGFGIVIVRIRRCVA